jgi:hypothetical protein
MQCCQTQIKLNKQTDKQTDDVQLLTSAPRGYAAQPSGLIARCWHEGAQTNINDRRSDKSVTWR